MSNKSVSFFFFVVNFRVVGPEQEKNHDSPNKRKVL